jgi:protein-S-isoprenylcysteine O-methyltransferase Ste14
MRQDLGGNHQVVALRAVMATRYCLLARDEERRMLGRFGDEYRSGSVPR